MVLARLATGRALTLLDNNSYSYVVYVGTVGPTQKYVIITSSKNINGHIYVEKVGVSTTARAYIEHEIKILCAIGGRYNFKVPKVRESYAQFGGLSQSYLCGGQSGSAFTLNHAKQLIQLVESGKTHNITKVDLMHEIENIIDTTSVSFKLSDVVDEIFSGEEEYLVPVCVEHGDYAPWNILLIDGDYSLVDWESAVLSGYPLFDAFHFFHTIYRLLDGVHLPADEMKNNLGFNYLVNKLGLAEIECDLLHLMFLLKKSNEAKFLKKNTEYEYYKNTLKILLAKMHS